MSAWLVIFCLTSVAAADECSSTCESKTDEGCDGRWKVGGKVVTCAEWTRYQIQCVLWCCNNYLSGMEWGVSQVVSMQVRSTPGARQGCHGTTVGWRGSLPGVRTV
jgi:hypothetical protein